MASLFCSDEDFAADVAALQDAYASRCAASDWDASEGTRFVTVSVEGARGEWVWDAAKVSR